MTAAGRTLEAAAKVIGAGREVARVFRADASQRVELDHAAHAAALDQFRAEFGGGASGFDRFVNGLNRLPRPLLAFGTLGMFVYAMCAPLGFAARMEGLAYVPEPLWWLLGAIVGFYFGARELHYLRPPRPRPRPAPSHSAWHHDGGGDGDAPGDEGHGDDAPNDALEAWRQAG